MAASLFSINNHQYCSSATLMMKEEFVSAEAEMEICDILGGVSK